MPEQQIDTSAADELCKQQEACAEPEACETQDDAPSSSYVHRNGTLVGLAMGITWWLVAAAACYAAAATVEELEGSHVQQ